MMVADCLQLFKGDGTVRVSLIWHISRNVGLIERALSDLVYRDALAALRHHSELRYLGRHLLPGLGSQSWRNALLWRSVYRHRILQLWQIKGRVAIRLLWHAARQGYKDPFEPSLSAQVLFRTSTWFAGVWGQPSKQCPEHAKHADVVSRHTPGCRPLARRAISSPEQCR
jgi:hypothetical protein